MTLDDAQAIAQVREGDANAFDSIVERYQPLLLRYLARLTGDNETAKDLLQKTFIDAHRGILSSNSELSLKAWLYRIATNNALQHLRRKRLIDFIPFSALSEVFTSRLSAPVQDTDERLAVEQSLLEVPTDQRTPMVLHFVEGFRYREIAEMLHISEEAVRKRVARGSQRFKQAYQAGEGSESS